MALFTRTGDVSGIDPTDFVSNLLVGNVAYHPEVTTGMVATGEQAFYDPLLAPPAASTTATTANVPETPAATDSTMAAGSTAAAGSSSDPGVVAASTPAADYPEADQTTSQPAAADHDASGQGDGTRTAEQAEDRQTDLASADSQAACATDAGQAAAPQDVTGTAGDRDQTHAAMPHHPGDSFHFATLASDGGEHTMPVVGEHLPPGATVTDMQADLPDIDIGSIVQDWLHGLHQDWHMPC